MFLRDWSPLQLAPRPVQVSPTDFIQLVNRAGVLAATAGALGYDLQQRHIGDDDPDAPPPAEDLRRIEQLARECAEFQLVITEPAGGWEPLSEILRLLAVYVRDTRLLYQSRDHESMGTDLVETGSELRRVIDNLVRQYRLDDLLGFLDNDLTPPGATDVTATKQPQAPEDQGVTLHVTNWSRFSLGVRTHGNGDEYWGFPFPLRKGSPVSLHKGKPLLLGGKRFQILFRKFLKSSDGHTASVAELVDGFGYRGQFRALLERFKDKEDPVACAIAEGKAVAELGLQQLKSAMNDLARKLRRRVDGPIRRGTSAFSFQGEEYRAAFVTQAIIPGTDRNLWFGRVGRERGG